MNTTGKKVLDRPENSSNSLYSFLLKVLTLCVLIFAICPGFGVSADQNTAKKLMARLGCPSCHPGLSDETNNLKYEIPNLTRAGLRFNPGYLYEYLQNPKPVRRHIETARMPNFSFKEDESLALTLFLMSQKNQKGLPAYPDIPKYSPQPEIIPDLSIEKEFQCTGCHISDAGKEQFVSSEIYAADLKFMGVRLKKSWIQKWLISPEVLHKGTPMPGLFFNHEEKRGFQKITQEPLKKISVISEYLFSLGTKERNTLNRSFEKARIRFAKITASMGEIIFQSQNCASCHNTPPFVQSLKKNGPDLSFEGARVKKQWVLSYLKKPTPIRPFGYYPGTGSRMPNFNLSSKEAETITSYLMSQKAFLNQKQLKFVSKKLSLFSMNKALTLLKTKLSCLGCHQLGSEGGRIGPDLSYIADRLQPSYLFNIIQNPHTVISIRSMPKVRMPIKTVTLLANFLLQYKPKTNKSSPLSLTKRKILSFEQNGTGEMLYMQYCSSCHGISGKGNGYNATYLNGKPAVFANKAYISTRPDDVLFDGISSGGYILNKSHLMPPWGDTLLPEEIKKIIQHIRKLCRCQGPDWSRDNGY